MRKCTKCNEEKDETIENFGWILKKGRFESRCKICRAKRRREIRSLKPKIPRKKRDRKPDEYYKEYKKRWIHENRERIRKVVHLNYLKNKDKVLERTRRWKQLHKEKFNECVKGSHKKDPQKQRARKILNYHLKKGNIKKPENCEECMENKKLQAHHDDYKIALQVRWLCSSCHAYTHRKFKSEDI